MMEANTPVLPGAQQGQTVEAAPATPTSSRVSAVWPGLAARGRAESSASSSTTRAIRHGWV